LLPLFIRFHAMPLRRHYAIFRYAADFRDYWFLPAAAALPMPLFRHYFRFCHYATPLFTLTLIFRYFDDYFSLIIFDVFIAFITPFRRQPHADTPAPCYADFFRYFAISCFRHAAPAPLATFRQLSRCRLFSPAPWLAFRCCRHRLYARLMLMAIALFFRWRCLFSLISYCYAFQQLTLLFYAILLPPLLPLMPCHYCRLRCSFSLLLLIFFAGCCLPLPFSMILPFFIAAFAMILIIIHFLRRRLLFSFSRLHLLDYILIAISLSLIISLLRFRHFIFITFRHFDAATFSSTFQFSCRWCWCRHFRCRYWCFFSFFAIFDFHYWLRHFIFSLSPLLIRCPWLFRCRLSPHFHFRWYFMPPLIFSYADIFADFFFDIFAGCHWDYFHYLPPPPLAFAIYRRCRFGFRWLIFSAIFTPLLLFAVYFTLTLLSDGCRLPPSRAPVYCLLYVWARLRRAYAMVMPRYNYFDVYDTAHFRGSRGITMPLIISPCHAIWYGLMPRHIMAIDADFAFSVFRFAAAFIISLSPVFFAITPRHLLAISYFHIISPMPISDIFAIFAFDYFSCCWCHYYFFHFGFSLLHCRHWFDDYAYQPLLIDAMIADFSPIFTRWYCRRYYAITLLRHASLPPCRFAFGFDFLIFDIFRHFLRAFTDWYFHAAIIFADDIDSFLSSFVIFTITSPFFIYYFFASRFRWFYAMSYAIISWCHDISPPLFDWCYIIFIAVISHAIAFRWRCAIITRCAFSDILSPFATSHFRISWAFAFRRHFDFQLRRHLLSHCCHADFSPDTLCRCFSLYCQISHCWPDAAFLSFFFAMTLHTFTPWYWHFSPPYFRRHYAAAAGWCHWCLRWYSWCRHYWFSSFSFSLPLS